MSQKDFMLIGIDGNEANVEKRVGIGEYAYELLLQFANIKYLPSTPLRTRISNIKYIVYLKDKPREDLPRETESWRYRVIAPKKLWTQIGLPFDLYFHKPRPDIFFSPTHYAPRFSPIPTVISIMDLSYIHFLELFKKSDSYQLRNWTSYSVKKAKKIFTISQASKDDIIETYRIPESKIVVTYPGIKESRIMNQELGKTIIKDKYGINEDYILFVGTLQPRKNITSLIEAFAKISKLKTQRSKLQLIIIGKKGWMYEEILNAPKKFGVEDKVKFLDFVSDEDLNVFYKNAVCFVLPSLYEGFGLPVLEAMKWGCPVITSSVSSLPEAGEDAAIYVDPENIDDIVSKIQLLMRDHKLRLEMIEKGYKQVKKFSWEKTARETLKVLEEVTRT